MKKKIIIFLGLFFIVTNAFAQGLENKIIYSRFTNGYWQIWSYSLDLNQHEQLTKSAYDKRNPICIDIKGKIIFRSSNANMYLLDTNTAKEEQILKDLGRIAYPAWSEQNNSLAFTRYDDTLTDESELWTVALDGTGQRVLTNLPGMQYDASWSNDGKHILYSALESYGKHHIWIMDIDGKNSKQLTSNDKAYDLSAVFSPDDKTIAFASNQTGNFEIWLMDNNGKNLKNITNNNAFDAKPTFSPDAKQIAFVSSRSNSLQIWIMNTDGSNPVMISDGKEEAQDPFWVK
ncbi:MAG: DUF5050 domain-containing protein [Candidatus Omnitrophica bacterium]|nr:DUF5050 domain-containing protein [Candidatus Omnitrophota bacterium]